MKRCPSNLKLLLDKLCNLAREELSISNLCKADDSVINAFSEFDPSVTEGLVTALSKLTTNQEAIVNRLDELCKFFEDRNTT